MAKLPRESRDGPLGGFRIELQRPPCKLVSGNAPEHHVSIRNGRVKAGAVTCRSGRSTRAFGANAEAATRIDSGDRTSSCTDGVDVEHGDADGVVIDAGLGGEAGTLAGKGYVS